MIQQNNEYGDLDGKRVCDMDCDICPTIHDKNK
jgi:hypothetical protein